MHFGISEGKGGLKHGSRPWLGMDIFWNCPIVNISNMHIVLSISYHIFILPCTPYPGGF